MTKNAVNQVVYKSFLCFDYSLEENFMITEHVVLWMRRMAMARIAKDYFTVNEACCDCFTKENG